MRVTQSAGIAPPACGGRSHPRTPYAGRTPPSFCRRDTAAAGRAASWSLKRCRSTAAPCRAHPGTRPQWPAADPVPRPVHPGQTDSRRRKSPRSACGAEPPAQTVLFLLPVHRPGFPPVLTCLLSLCRTAPPAAQISRLIAVTVTRFRALRPLREYK